MKCFLLAAVGLVFLGIEIAFQPVVAGTNAPEVRLTVELRDGSRVVGSPVETNLKFRSVLLGEFQLAFADILSVDCVSSNSAKVATSQGDALTVKLSDSALALQTGFGKVEVAPDLVRRITVSTAGAGLARRPGLVALWSGEDNGDDATGSHPAEMTDIAYAEGKVGRAFVFNGFSSWGTVPAARGFDFSAADGLSLLAWIKPNNVNGFHPVLEWEVTKHKSAVMVWIARRPQDQGVLSANLVDTDGRNHELSSPPGILVTGQFQHIAVSYDKASGTGRLFVNGRIVAQDQFGTMTPDTAGPLFFSRRPSDQPGDWTYNTFFSGLLDEVAIYNRGLSPEEIRDVCAGENHGELPPPPVPRQTTLPWRGPLRAY